MSRSSERQVPHLLLLLVLFTASACSDSPSGPPSGTSLSGAYTLSTVNGVAVPGVIYTGECEVWIESGTLTFLSAARVDRYIAVTVDCPGTVDDESGESTLHYGYQYADGAITLFNPDSGVEVMSGTVTNNSIRMNEADYVFVYRR